MKWVMCVIRVEKMRSVDSNCEQSIGKGKKARLSIFISFVAPLGIQQVKKTKQKKCGTVENGGGRASQEQSRVGDRGSGGWV